MPAIINLSAYRFVPLDGLPTLKSRLLTAATNLHLKGTVLLSAEGINLFVAGSAGEVHTFIELVRSVPGLDDLAAKISRSAAQPFGRMRVKIKQEIIAFGVPGIDPHGSSGRKLAPRQLKRWLDEGRPVLLLDTRNEYEVARGTFRGAVAAGIQRFRDFPGAVRRLPPATKDQTVVMFCTGGIRCEKAGPLMEREGYREVYQLDGGILKYFEECGGAHYDGECFVFDEREGLDPSLHPAGSGETAGIGSPRPTRTP